MRKYGPDREIQKSSSEQGHKLQNKRINYGGGASGGKDNPGGDMRKSNATSKDGMSYSSSGRSRMGY